jgi:hypothetical protein
MTGRSLLAPAPETAAPAIHEVGSGGFRQHLELVSRGASSILLRGGRVA